jgi:hypothetical protein
MAVVTPRLLDGSGLGLKIVDPAPRDADPDSIVAAVIDGETAVTLQIS